MIKRFQISTRELLYTLGVLAIGFVLALLAFMWKGYQLSNLSSVIIGDKGDTITFSSLVYQAIDNLTRRPTQLGYAPFFYSEPAPFTYTVGPYGIAVAVLPIYGLTGFDLELTMNIYILLTFALTAWATYLLIRYLLNASPSIAFVMSMAVAFAQFRFLHLVHIETLSTQFYLFAIYFLHRFIDAPRPKWVVALSVSFWFTFLTSGYLGFAFAITAVIILCYLFFMHRGKFTGQFIRASFAVFVLTAVLLLPFLSIRFQKSNALGGYSLQEIRSYSATPAEWFSGSSFLYFNLTGAVSERTIFIGFTPLILAGLAWYWKHDRRMMLLNSITEIRERAFSPTQVVHVYTIVTVVGYILTLGPLIQLGSNSSLPSPYILLLQIPGFASLRVPSRFILMAVVGTAPMGAYALTLMERRMARARYYGVFAFIVACLLLELIPYFDLASTRDNSFVILSSADAARTNVTNDPISIPAKAYDWLARQSPDTAVFDYPARPDANRQYMYGLQYHGHPMLNGQASFFPTWYANVDWNTFPTPSIFFQLRRRGISYVLVHNRLMTDAERTRLNRRMGDYLTDGWLSYAGSYDDVDIYRLASVAPLEAVRIEFDAPVIGTGWDVPEYDKNNRTFTWTSSPTATLDVWIKPSNDLKAEFLVNNAMTTGILDSLRLSVNGIDVPLERRARAEGDLFSGIIPASAYKGQSDLLEFTFQTSSVIRPSAIDPNNSDPRQLGLSLDWLNVSPYEHVAVDDFDAATKGTGWDVSEFDAQKNTFRWMSSTESTLELPYHPVGDTAIIIRLNNVLTSEIWNSLSVSCRNYPIVLSRVGNPPDVYYRGIIPASAMPRDVSTVTLTFRVARKVSPKSLGRSQDPRELGVAIDWVRLYPVNDVRFEFDGFPAWAGLHPPELDPSGATYQWMSSPKASVMVPLLQGKETRIRFKIRAAVSPLVLNSLTLTVNDTPIPLNYSFSAGEHVFEGVIPTTAIKTPELNVLTFEIRELMSEQAAGLAPGNPPRLIGVAFDWLELKPVQE